MDYETIFLSGSLLIGLGGFVGLWFVSRHTPRGTVLAISVGLYLISQVMGPSRIRELHMLSGLLGMLGFGGGILGLLDLVKPRRTEIRLATDQQPSRAADTSSKNDTPSLEKGDVAN